MKFISLSKLPSPTLGLDIRDGEAQGTSTYPVTVGTNRAGREEQETAMCPQSLPPTWPVASSNRVRVKSKN